MNSSSFEEKEENISFEKSSSEDELEQNDGLLEIQNKVLVFENQSLKALVKKLENNNISLNDTVKKLRAANDREKCQQKMEIDKLEAASTEYLEKIKILEDENQDLKRIVKELNEQILLMKTIKSEIKENVEDEREKAQATIDKLNAKINELQTENNHLKEINGQYQKQIARNEKCETESKKNEVFTMSNNVEAPKTSDAKTSSCEKNVHETPKNDEEKLLQILSDDISDPKNVLPEQKESVEEKKIKLMEIIDQYKLRVRTSEITIAKMRANAIKNYDAEVAVLKEKFNKEIKALNEQNSEKEKEIQEWKKIIKEKEAERDLLIYGEKADDGYLITEIDIDERDEDSRKRKSTSDLNLVAAKKQKADTSTTPAPRLARKPTCITDSLVEAEMKIIFDHENVRDFLKTQKKETINFSSWCYLKYLCERNLFDLTGTTVAQKTSDLKNRYNPAKSLPPKRMKKVEEAENEFFEQNPDLEDKRHQRNRSK